MDDAADEAIEDYGADPEEIERIAAASYVEEGQDDVWVYPVNHDAARVFLACHWQRTAVTGPEGTHLFFEGIATEEVRAVAEMMRVPPEQWAQVLAGVRIMEATALPIRNRTAGQ